MLLIVIAEPIFLLLLAFCNFLFLQFLYNVILKIKHLTTKCHCRIKIFVESLSTSICSTRDRHYKLKSRNNLRLVDSDDGRIMSSQPSGPRYIEEGLNIP